MNNYENADEIRPAYVVELDDSNTPVSQTIVEAVVQLTAKAESELEPLWHTVEPDALDSFAAHSGAKQTAYQLRFQYEGCMVEIIDGQLLRVIPHTERTPSP